MTDPLRPALLILVLFTSAFALAAAEPLPPPGTAPAAATTAPARHAMVMPPGFSALAVGPRTAVCEATDEAWVRQTLEQVTPTTLPTTMPADVAHDLAQRRDLLKARIATDLALPDPKLTDTLLGETLVNQVKRLGQIDPPVFYMVCSDAKLKTLVKNGWQDPRFYYNRAADDVAYDSELRLSDDRPMDDMIMPAIYHEGATEDVKRRTLDQTVRHNEGAIAAAIANRGLVVTQLGLIQFIDKNGIEPLKLTPDQMWFGYGIEAVLSARYMADLTGLNFDTIVARMAMDDPRNPVRTTTVDLLHPADRSTMRPQWVQPYANAYNAKSARVIYDWYKKAGDSSVSLMITAMRKKAPPDGPALLKLIQLTTNVDLSDAVKPH